MSEYPNTKYIRHRIFPAAVTIDQEKMPQRNLKTFITDSYVYVFTDSPTGPTLVSQHELIDYRHESTTKAEADTPEGTIKISRATGCGCGSRLKSFDPFRGVPMQSTGGNK